MDPSLLEGMVGSLAPAAEGDTLDLQPLFGLAVELLAAPREQREEIVETRFAEESRIFADTIVQPVLEKLGCQGMAAGLGLDLATDLLAEYVLHGEELNVGAAVGRWAALNARHVQRAADLTDISVHEYIDVLTHSLRASIRDGQLPD